MVRGTATDKPTPKPPKVEMCDIRGIKVTARQYKLLEKAAKVERQTIVQYVTWLLQEEADSLR